MVSSITSTETHLMPHTCILSSMDQKFWFLESLDFTIANKGLLNLYLLLYSAIFIATEHTKYWPLITKLFIYDPTK